MQILRKAYMSPYRYGSEIRASLGEFGTGGSLVAVMAHKQTQISKDDWTLAVFLPYQNMTNRFTQFTASELCEIIASIALRTADCGKRLGIKDNPQPQPNWKQYLEEVYALTILAAEAQKELNTRPESKELVDIPF
jgi:hypothetical protein